MNETLDHRLIVLGLRCPVPVLMAARAIGELAPGEHLEVIGDDPEMLRDFPAWCGEAGHRLLACARMGEAIHCRIEKGPAATLDG